MVDTIRPDADILSGLTSPVDDTASTTKLRQQALRDFLVTMRATTGPVPDPETASFTLSLAAHQGKGLVRCEHASTPIVVTVPANSTAAFPLNTLINLAQWGVAAVTFASAGGVTIRLRGGFNAQIDGQYSVVTIFKTGVDEWFLFGGLAAA